MISNPRKLLKLLFIFALQNIAGISYAQTLNISVKASLPLILTESSGIAITDRNSIWSHNDGGGNPELYNFDSTGTLLRTLKILNASNIDWEDLAKDSIGNFYIGDFGNNLNTRQDLKIYILPDPSTIPADSVIPQVINYSYPDQFAFPPPDSLKNFDMEAMVASHGFLYLFSKDWSNPYSGFTKLYKLPTLAGTYVAELIDSFYTGTGSPYFYSITSADINTANNKLVLLGYNKIWLFSDFSGNDFFSGTTQLFNLPTLTQKEAICFISDNEFYATDEILNGTGQKLYYISILQDPTNTSETANNAVKIDVFPNPFSEKSTLSISTKKAGSYTVTIYDPTGQTIFTKTVFSSPEIVQHIFLEESIFKNRSGVFIIEVTSTNKTRSRKKMIKL